MKELADRIVTQGVGMLVTNVKGIFKGYDIVVRDKFAMSAEEFVNDGRVVLTMMKLVRKRRFSFLLASMSDDTAMMTIQSSLPNKKKKNGPHK